MANQLPALNNYEEEMEASQAHLDPQMVSHPQGLSKSTNSLPPFANQSRVSKIKHAMAANKDDDFERAHDSKMASFNQPSPQNQAALHKSTLSRGSSQNLIDAECEKLKESYTQHRRQRNSQSRERSKSGLRANSRSIGRQALIDGSVVNPLVSIDKENTSNNDGGLRNSLASSSFQNRYKRNQSNQKSLQNYQEKYNKLEENFKKFTQGLQDKRTTSASGRLAFQTINQSSGTSNLVSSYMPAAVAQPQPHAQQQSSFGPIKSEVSPIRQRKASPFQTAQLDVSQQFNPVVGMSMTVTPQQNRASHVDKSLHLEHLLSGAPPTAAQQHPNQVLFTSVENQVPEGASRLQMLHNLVTRMNHFMETCFTKLVSLCISKQQEKQLIELHARVKQLVNATSVSVQKITSEDSPELADESMKVKEVYRQCVENLQNCFQEILTRIYQVESETFKSYKFKDTMGALELILQESHRLNLYELLPQLIDNLKLRKIQAAAGMLQSQLSKRKLLLQKQSFVNWRSKAGLNKFLTRTFRQATLSKAVHRLVRNWSQRSASRYLHLWRQILFNRKQEIAHNSEGGSLVETLLLDSQKFNDCLQEDASLAIHIASQVKDLLGDYCDVQFLTQEQIPVSMTQADDEDADQVRGNGDIVEVLTGFEYESGVARTVALNAIEKNSITGLSLKRTPRGEGSVRVTQAIFANQMFNEQVDAPLLPKQFLGSQQFQDLEMLAMPLYDAQLNLIGLMRVYTAAHFTEEMQGIYLRTAEAIGLFCNRMQVLRSNFSAMQRDIHVKNDQIELHALESCVQSCLYDILHGLQEGTKSEFLYRLETRSNKMLDTLLPGLRLRQIYHKVRDTRDKFVLKKIVHKAILGDDQVSGTQCLVRQKDHKAEKEQLLEDFLDLQQDKVTHQVSVDSDSFNFVLHRDLPKGAVFVRETLSQSLKFTVTLFTSWLQPVLLQGLKIHEELAIQVKNQSRELVRQVSINSTTEDLRAMISKMIGLQEHQAYETFAASIHGRVSDSDLMNGAQIVSFQAMLNQGVLTGQPLAQAHMFAYLTSDQNELLQMPERFDIEFSPQEDDGSQQISRYQAQASDYTHIRQQMQVKDQDSISVVLPLCTEQNLLSLIKMEIVLDQEDADKQQTIQDIKALLSALQSHTQKALMQIVFAQANQNYHFKECFEQLQQQIGNLTMDLDFSQALQEHLVLPFTQAPSAKCLGVALTSFAKRVLPQLDLSAISLWMDGREAIQDIRMLDWRYIVDDSNMRGTIDKHIPVAFNIQDRTICVYLEGDCDRRGLSLRFNLTREVIDEAKEEAHDFILQQCQVFQLVVTPFVQAAMSALSMTALITSKQEQLPRVLTKVVMQRKYGHIYNLFMRLKELQVNKVPIFTRLASYRHIVKLRYEQWGIEPQIGYGQEAKREYLIREKVLLQYAKTFKSLNTLGLKVKDSYFGHLKTQVLAQMHHEQATLQYRAAYQPTKLQRKAIGLIYKNSKMVNLRAYFAKFAVYTNRFSRLNNPHIKEMGAAMCIFSNYLRMKQRRAFQRMRANATQVYFRDFAGAEVRDREYLLSLTRQLLSTNLNTQDASRLLEESLMSLIGQALSYLQKQMCAEQVDLIVCSVQQPNGRKARAFTFHNKKVDDRRTAQMQRVTDSEVIDGVTSANIDMLAGPADAHITDFNLNFKRDIILQMLGKGQTAFNFNNISQSLYDLYLNHLGRGAGNNFGVNGYGSAVAAQNADPDTVKRMIVVKKSKSALLLPLLAPALPKSQQSLNTEEEENANYTTAHSSELHLVGSLELYKYHFQPFDEELEKRISIFAKIFAIDVLPVYFSLRQTQLQIDNLRKQAQRNTRPVTSLTQLLRQVYFNAPTQLNASLVLPIIIDQKSKMASFFQFKDNHIYNFAYANTFIGELVDLACVLELACASDQIQNNNLQDGDETDASNNTDRSRGGQDIGNSFLLQESQSQLSHFGMNHKRRNLDPNQVRSITNEKFAHILYYPICGPLGRTKAVVEVCFNEGRSVPKNVITSQIQTFLETFGGQLQMLESRLRTFCKFTESSVCKREGIKKAKHFQRWKAGIQFEAQRREFVDNQKQTINQTEQCFNEYVKSLECYDNELKKIAAERDELKTQLATVNLDRTAKYKFLGASLIILNNMERIRRRGDLQGALQRWRNNQSVSKIAEKAFNKILELNHKHSRQRFESACFLMTKSVGKLIKKDAMERISQYATMAQLRHHRNKKFHGSSFATSVDFSPNRYAGGYESRKSGDKLSNIVRVGIQSSSANASSAIIPTPSVPYHSSQGNFASSMTQQNNKMSGLSSFMTPNASTSRQYDAHMQSFGVQMGFGAVPSRITAAVASTSSMSQKRRRSKSRSQSQQRRPALIQK